MRFLHEFQESIANYKESLGKHRNYQGFQQESLKIPGCVPTEMILFDSYQSIPLCYVTLCNKLTFLYALSSISTSHVRSDPSWTHLQSQYKPHPLHITIPHPLHI